VELGVLAQVRQLARGKATEEALDELRKVAAGDVVTELSERETEDAAVERVVRVVGLLGREAGLEQPGDAIRHVESRHARGKVVVTV
jgi:hypothetical protein